MPIEINEIRNQTEIQGSLQSALARIAQLELNVAILRSALDVSPGGEVTLSGRSLTIKADHVITIQSACLLDLRAGTIKASATTIDGTAASIKCNSAMSNFSGMIQCDVIQANTVIGASYTPGAGNIW